MKNNYIEFGIVIIKSRLGKTTFKKIITYLCRELNFIFPPENSGGGVDDNN